ncbi:MAG: metallophosphoesterase [Firmicutes bacterium]|nr:metallophosphoesterase [Bacillota bacterium]
MRIGVISDTHIPTRARHLPAVLFEHFADVDLILHAGDLVDPQVLVDLAAIAPVEAVAGNMDSPELQNKLGSKKILELAGFRIGLTHGHLGSYRHHTPQRALSIFAQDAVDVVIFGHSHQPYLKKEKGILLFNPGSPTDRRRQPRHSCGLLLLDQKITAEIIYLS